jgi:hypothetical protein
VSLLSLPLLKQYIERFGHSPTVIRELSMWMISTEEVERRMSEALKAGEPVAEWVPKPYKPGDEVILS